MLNKSDIFYPSLNSGRMNQFQLEFKVRDYELDLQGIVNNSVYQNYLEHTRHEFITSKGIDFAKMHQEGTDLVVARIELAYKTPLKSGDSFISGLNVQKEGIKYIFHQTIHRLPDNQLCLKAKVTTVGIVNGKLCSVKRVDALFDF